MWSLTSRSPHLRIRRLIWRGSVHGGGRPAMPQGRNGAQYQPGSRHCRPALHPARPLLLGCWLHGPHSSAISSSLFSLDLSAVPGPRLLLPCSQGYSLWHSVCADCALITDLWASFLQAACQTWPADLDLPASGLVKPEMHSGTVKYEYRRATQHSYQGDI